MKSFNENPFAKDTPVHTFSNSMEAMFWHGENCDNCLKYDVESKSEEESKCPLAFYLDMGFITGEIPLWVCKEIGVKYDPLYQHGEFGRRCRHYKDESMKNLPF
jgi:hypothetical protein